MNKEIEIQKKAEELLNIGAQAYREGDYDKAEKYYRQSADMGHPAIFTLMVGLGTVILKMLFIALTWLLSMAMQMLPTRLGMPTIGEILFKSSRCWHTGITSRRNPS